MTNDLRCWRIVGLALCIFASTHAHAQPNPETKTARDAAILADGSFFKPDFVTRLRRLAAAGVRRASLAIPPPDQPIISDIIKKYGEADKVTEQSRGPSGPGLPEAPIDKVYSFGKLELSVPKDSKSGNVEMAAIRTAN